MYFVLLLALNVVESPSVFFSFLQNSQYCSKNLNYITVKYNMVVMLFVICSNIMGYELGWSDLKKGPSDWHWYIQPNVASTQNISHFIVIKKAGLP